MAIAKLDKIPHHDTWYETYPNKKAPGDSRKAYKKAEAEYDGTPMEFLTMCCVAVKAQKRWRAQQKGTGVFVPSWRLPATWLRSESWADMVEINERAKITVGAQCVKCKNPVMGPRFKFCEEHESWQMSKTMVVEMTAMYNKLKLTCTTVDEWRAKYRELAKLGLGGNHEKT